MTVVNFYDLSSFYATGPLGHWTRPTGNSETTTFYPSLVKALVKQKGAAIEVQANKDGTSNIDHPVLA